MKLVVDTNIIFSALIKDPLARRIITHSNLELYTINFSKKELLKYEKEILKKAKISATELYLILEKLNQKLNIIDDKVVALKINEGIKIMKKIDIKDSPFIAAALAIKADLWSEDKHFNKQDKIKVWKTKDLIEFV